MNTDPDHIDLTISEGFYLKNPVIAKAQADMDAMHEYYKEMNKPENLEREAQILLNNHRIDQLSKGYSRNLCIILLFIAIYVILNLFVL